MPKFVIWLRRMVKKLRLAFSGLVTLPREMSPNGIFPNYPGPTFQEKPASFVTTPAFRVEDYRAEYAEALARYDKLVAKDKECKARLGAALDEIDRISLEIKKAIDERQKFPKEEHHEGKA